MQLLRSSATSCSFPKAQYGNEDGHIYYAHRKPRITQKVLLLPYSTGRKGHPHPPTALAPKSMRSKHSDLASSTEHEVAQPISLTCFHAFHQVPMPFKHSGQLSKESQALPCFHALHLVPMGIITSMQPYSNPCAPVTESSRAHLHQSPPPGAPPTPLLLQGWGWLCPHSSPGQSCAPDVHRWGGRRTGACRPAGQNRALSVLNSSGGKALVGGEMPAGQQGFTFRAWSLASRATGLAV